MWSKNRQILMVVGVLSLVAGAAVAVAAVQGNSPAEQGREEYIELGCYQCHGYQGQGGPGGRLAPKPIALENFIGIVRRPPNVMPAYSPAVLSEEQLERMHAYLESIPQPPEVSTLPLLSGE